MPFYDFVCTACGHDHELRTTMSEYARKGKPACPACCSSKTERKPAAFATTGKAGAPTGPCGMPSEGCGMGAGPGGCRRDV